MKPVSRRRLAALAAALALAGCDRSKAGAGDPAAAASTPAAPQTDAELDAPIAKIDGEVISVRDFQDRINQQSPYIRARYNSTEQKKEFLDSLIRYEILAKEAYRRGLDKDPEAVRAMKTVMIQKLMKAQLESAVSPEDIPEADLHAYYDAHPDEWNKPEEVRVSAIVVDGKKQADAISKAALGPDGRSNKGFRDLIAKHSVDEASKLRGGDLRYFTQASVDLPAPVVAAAFALAKTGDVAGPVDGGKGRFYFIKQTGRRRAIAKTFEQVKRQIQNTLWKDRRAESQKLFVDGLKAKAKVEVFDAALKNVRVSSSGEGDGDGHGHGAPGGPAAGEVAVPTPPAAAPGGDR